MNEYFKIDLLARMCHGANAAWERHFGIVRPAWIDEPEEKRYGYRKMVELFSLGHTPEAVHAECVKDKIAKGWKLGDRNDALKQDPYLLPWDQLCLKMQLKYKLYERMVSVFL